MKVILDAGLPYFAAILDGTLVGYAYAGVYHARPGYRNTVENSIYIAPESHRCGAGRALLKALIAECERQRFRQMIAVIGDSDNVASRRLHEGEGFTLVGVLKNVGYKHGRWLDSVLMQRSLGSGATAPPER